MIDLDYASCPIDADTMARSSSPSPSWMVDRLYACDHQGFRIAALRLVAPSFCPPLRCDLNYRFDLCLMLVLAAWLMVSHSPPQPSPPKTYSPSSPYSSFSS